MTARSFLAAALAATLITPTGSALAEQPQPAVAAPAPDEGEGDGIRGAAVPGLVLAIVGGAAALAGGGILLVGSTSQPEDPGDVPALGGALLGGGAVVHALGIGLFFAGSWSDEDDPPSRAAARAPAARVQPVVSPGFTGLCGTF
jgi:hypothetical protein